MPQVNIRIGQRCYYVDNYFHVIRKSYLKSFISDHEWEIHYFTEGKKSIVAGTLGVNIFLTEKKSLLTMREIKGLEIIRGSNGDRCSECLDLINHLNLCSCITSVYENLHKDNRYKPLKGYYEEWNS